MTVFPGLQVSVNSVANDHNGQGSGTISITATGSNLVYAWSKDGQPYSTSEDLTGLTAGVYNLVVTDANGCSTTLDVQVQNTVGIDNPETDLVRLYPNPCSQSFQLEVTGAAIEAAHMYDLQGKLVHALNDLEWDSNVEVSELANGIYFLRLRFESGQVATLKFVKGE